MSRRLMCILAFGLSLSAGQAAAQPNAAPIIKNDAVPLPAGARLQFPKLAAVRYAGRPATATLSADGKLLAAADAPDTITIVNTETGKIVQTLKTNIVAAYTGLTFSADGSTLGVQSLDTLTVWDVASGKLLLKRNADGSRHQGPSLSADGKIVGAVTVRRAVAAIDIAADKTIGPFESIHNNSMRTALAAEGKTLVSWGKHTGDREAGNTIQIWDLVKGKQRHSVFIFSNILAVAVAPDGKSIVAHTGAGNFHWIDIETGMETRRFAGDFSDATTMRFAPDGRRLVAFDDSGSVQAWDVTEQKRIGLVKPPMTQVIGVAFPDKDRIVLLGMLGSTLMWWDAAGPKVADFEVHHTPIAALAFTADGKSIVSAGASGRLIWWDLATGKEQRQLSLAAEDKRRPGGGRPVVLALAPGGKYAAAKSQLGFGGNVQLWDLEQGRPIRDLELPRSSRPVTLEFSADGSKLSAAPGSVWDVGSGQGVFAIPLTPRLGMHAAVSPDGKILAVYQFDRYGNDPSINETVLWDMIANKKLRRIEIPAPVRNSNYIPGMAFSADGKFLAVSDGEGAILLLSTANGRECRKLTSTVGAGTLSFTFSGDGRFIAASRSPPMLGTTAQAADATVEVWEFASGQKREQFKGHASDITCLAFSPDGATLATGSMDTTVILWDLTGKHAKAAPFAQSEIPAAWKSLTGADANLSLTMRRLIQSPATVGFLKQNFQPAKPADLDDKKLARLIADLDSGNFKARELAMRDLRLLGERAEPALKKGLAGNPSVEARRRIVDLLDALVRTQVTPEELQAIRGVEILERIGTADARACLTALAKGDPFARSTHEAAATLKRMGKD